MVHEQPPRRRPIRRLPLRINELDASAIAMSGEMFRFGTLKYLNERDQSGERVDDGGAAGLRSSFLVSGRDGARRMKKVVAHAAHRYHRLPSGERTIPRTRSRPHHGHAAGWPSVESDIRSVTLVSCGAVSPARWCSPRTIGKRSPASRSQDQPSANRAIPPVHRARPRGLVRFRTRPSRS